MRSMLKKGFIFGVTELFLGKYTISPFPSPILYFL